jgi:hypothetical protein
MTAIDLSSLLDLSLLSYLAALSGLCTSTETKAIAAAEARAPILVRIIKGRTLLTFLITLNSHRPKGLCPQVATRSPDCKSLPETDPVRSNSMNVSSKSAVVLIAELATVPAVGLQTLACMCWREYSETYPPLRSACPFSPLSTLF